MESGSRLATALVILPVDSRRARVGPAMVYPLAPFKTPWIADSRKPLQPRAPRSATGAVRAAQHLRSPQLPAKRSLMSGLRSAVGPVSAPATRQGSRSARILRVAEAMFPCRSFWGALVTTPPSRAAVGPGRGAAPALRNPSWRGPAPEFPLASASGLRSHPVQRNATKPTSAPDLTGLNPLKS